MSRRNSDLIWILVAVVVLLVGVPLLLMGMMSTMGFWGGHMGGPTDMMGTWGFGWWWLMPLAGIFFLVLIALGIYYLVTEPARRTVKPETRETGRPLEILKERYARGEITAEEYARMKKELES